MVYVEGEPVGTPVPGDRRVQRTLYVTREAVDSETGQLIVYTQWDQDGDGDLDEDGARLFRTSLDVGAAANDTELDATVDVANWRQAPTTPTREATPTPGNPTATTGVAGPGFGVVSVIVAASVTLGLLLVGSRDDQ